MNKHLFTENTPGVLKKIKTYIEEDWAFVPYTLPTSIQIESETWPLLAEAREELGRLDGVGRHMSNYELLLKPLQRREALKSSSLEGTYATPEQLLLFGIDTREPKSGHDRNAWKEVFNYAKALRNGQELIANDRLPISLRLIKILHRELLSGVRGHHRDPGHFRKVQVHIDSDRRFIPPPPMESKQCLHDLETYIHANNDIDPLVFCFLVHYQFETIHPFLDGNGRVGRLLLSLMIYKWNNLTSPWLYLSPYFERYKDEYIQNLFNVSAKGDWISWINYCLRATTHQAKDAIKRSDMLIDLKNTYICKINELAGSSRLNTIIDNLFDSPILTIPQVCDTLGVTYPTASGYVQNLVKTGILSKEPTQRRPKVYFAREIMDIAFSDENN